MPCFQYIGVWREIKVSLRDYLESISGAEGGVEAFGFALANLGVPPSPPEDQ